MLTSPLHILIVDDHPIIRDGLRNMLESQNAHGPFIVYEAENESEAVKIVSGNPIELVIMDFQLPDKKGHEITRTIMEINPDLKVLGLSNYDEYAHALEMLKAGAKGYVLKNVGSKDLISAISQIMEGKVYYSNEIANKLINYKLKELLMDEPKFDPIHTPMQKTPLSSRELQIIRLIASEHTNEEIAAKLELSKRTVDNHRQNILNKLQLKNTAGLVSYAYKNGLMT